MPGDIHSEVIERGIEFWSLRGGRLRVPTNQHLDGLLKTAQMFLDNLVGDSVHLAEKDPTVCQNYLDDFYLFYRLCKSVSTLTNPPLPQFEEVFHELQTCQKREMFWGAEHLLHIASRFANQEIHVEPVSEERGGLKTDLQLGTPPRCAFIECKERDHERSSAPRSILNFLRKRLQKGADQLRGYADRAAGVLAVDLGPQPEEVFHDQVFRHEVRSLIEEGLALKHNQHINCVILSMTVFKAWTSGVREPQFKNVMFPAPGSHGVDSMMPLTIQNALDRAFSVVDESW